MNLQDYALAFAMAEVDHGVREVGGSNTGPRVRQYQENADPPIHDAVAWCALLVQYCSDVPARFLRMENPLDDVKREAFVNDYWEWAAPHKVVAPMAVRHGDLVVFSFGGKRWDHIGFVLRPPNELDGRQLLAIEGNTSDENQREGDAVAVKRRYCDGQRYPVSFIRWAA